MVTVDPYSKRMSSYTGHMLLQAGGNRHVMFATQSELRSELRRSKLGQASMTACVLIGQLSHCPTSPTEMQALSYL